MNISDYEVFIVQRGYRYLVAVAYEDTAMLRFSRSPYDAAQFTNRSSADRVADAVGGRSVRFNSITGRVSE